MRWPATGNSSPKAADLLAHERRKEDTPSLPPSSSPGPAAAEPSTGSDAGQVHAAPGSGLDARYEQLRHAALHARAEAFPLGFAVLSRGGVTAWRRALTDLAPDPGATRPAPAVPASAAAGPALTMPTPIAAQLVDALAAVTLAGT